MELIMLGTGAPMHPDRARTGMIVTAPGCEPLLIDTCGGMELANQLKLVGWRAQDIRNVIVTHRHQDHAGGVTGLMLMRRPLQLYALPDTHDGIKEAWKGCFPEWQLSPEMAWHEARLGRPIEIGGLNVEFFAAEHRVPTVAVRVSHAGRVLAFSADGIACRSLVACARNADLFLCDAICATTDGERHVEWAHAQGHTTAADACRIASEAGAGRLVCTHIANFADPARVEAEASTLFCGEAGLASDGQRFQV